MPTKTAAQKAEAQAPAAHEPSLEEFDSVFTDEDADEVIGKEHVSAFSEEPEQEPAFDWVAHKEEKDKQAQDDAIQAAVQDYIAKLGLDKLVEPVAPPSTFVAPVWKYHFRNDVNPSIKIQAMDMSALDRGERPQDNPLIGHWIEFHVGHLQTNDENTARQIKYMMEKPAVDANGQTVGGNLAIYEDDNSVVYRCPQCEFVTASPAGYKAHRRATHGEV